MSSDGPAAAPALITRADLPRLFEALQCLGYQIVGPTVRDGAIVYDELRAVEDLPIGWTDEQDGGTYRLKRRADQALFGYVVGPHSWKKFLHPPTLPLWQATKDGDGFQVTETNGPVPTYAFLGVRSCELHAIAIQDTVFLKGAYVDPTYQTRREQAFTIAVNCGQAGGTCFCVSMQTGPKATLGFDLALTELLSDDRHEFLVEVGSPRGTSLLQAVPHQPALEPDVQRAAERTAHAASQMGRTMDTTEIKDLLARNLEHPRWDEVAGRCLSCSNCTMVCPTCFCTTVEDVTDLTGTKAERIRSWDSCFTASFSHIHGGSIRGSVKSRYRQWLTHKLGTWIDQFGSSGCVGCGRCISWCPVAIDLTEEVRAIRATDGKGGDHGTKNA